MPPLSNEQLLLFQYTAWSPIFRDHAIKGVAIPLPADVVRHILQDGVFVAPDNAAIPALPTLDEYRTEDDYSRDKWSTVTTSDRVRQGGAGPEGEAAASGSDSEASDEEGEEGEGVATVHFPELEASIQAAIADLGGRVFPKANFSAPMDATWITVGNSMACTHADEVLLLFKSSDRVAMDLSEEAFSCCQPSTVPEAFRPTLVLKPYFDMRPEREFRCFVRRGRLVGISQRDLLQHYPQLAPERDVIRDALAQFFRQHVSGTFPLPDYSFDAYVTPRLTVKILDFNPWEGYSNPLLFGTWEELEELSLGPGSGSGEAAVGPRGPEAEAEAEEDGCSSGSDSAPEFRLTPTEAAMVPGKKFVYGVPYDFVGHERTVEEMLAQLQQQGMRGAY